MRTAALGLLGLVLAVAVGYGVHLITRETISLPVVQLEQPAPLAPPAATTTARTTTARRPRPRRNDDRGSRHGNRRQQRVGLVGQGRGRGRSGGDDDD